jgi:hypothetical protein
MTAPERSSLREQQQQPAKEAPPLPGSRARGGSILIDSGVASLSEICGIGTPPAFGRRRSFN